MKSVQHEAQHLRGPLCHQSPAKSGSEEQWCLLLWCTTQCLVFLEYWEVASNGAAVLAPAAAGVSDTTHSRRQGKDPLPHTHDPSSLCMHVCVCVWWCQPGSSCHHGSTLPCMCQPCSLNNDLSQSMSPTAFLYRSGHTHNSVQSCTLVLHRHALTLTNRSRHHYRIFVGLT